MRTRSALFLSVFSVVIAVSSASCDLINPEEQIPAFIRVDSFDITPAIGQGTDVHDIVDAWVFDNEQLVGVYELPATVPVLTTGDANIRIRPGIKLNGQVANRTAFQFLEDFTGTVELFEDSTVNINPTLSFKNAVATPWIEDFDSPPTSISNTSISQGSISLVSGTEAYEGNSALLTLPADQDLFECRVNSPGFDLPSAGATVILEFSYKCNHPFRLSLVSSNSGGSVQTPIIEISASDEWKHIYVSLTETTSAIFTANEHLPAFGFLRQEDFNEDVKVYLDNIRLMHFE